MKKLISTILFFALYCSLFAQNAVESTQTRPAVAHSITFFDIVMTSGAIGIVTWFAIFSITAIGFVLGILAIISSITVKSKQIPLPVKLLVTGLPLLFLFGLVGSVTGAVDAFAGLANASGAAKAQLLALSISQALYSLAFSLLGCIEYMFFTIISVIILHYKHKKIINKAL